MPENVFGFNGPLRTWLEKKLLDDVVAKGGDPTKAHHVIKELLQDKSIWEWLTSVNWQALITMILQILALLPK